MKRWTPVKVEWFDAHGGGENWDPVSSLPSDPVTITTVGLLARENTRVIVVVLSHDKSAERYADHILIPRCNVLTFTELTEKEIA